LPALSQASNDEDSLGAGIPSTMIMEFNMATWKVRLSFYHFKTFSDDISQHAIQVFDITHPTIPAR
jgi:hypothetical protein